MPELTAQQQVRAQRNMDAMGGRGINARDAIAAATAYARQMNGAKKIDEIPASIIKWARENPVHIFNVGPWPQRIFKGSLGSFFIPSCPEGKDYIEMTREDQETGERVPAIDGLIFEPLPEDGRMSIRQHDGIAVADDILGIGMGHAPQNSLLRVGCFRAAGAKPTREELAQAHARLHETLTALVSEARKAEQDGTTSQFIGPDHYTAARLLKLNEVTEPWMKVKAVHANEECPGCGSPYRKGIAVCKECRTILDEEKYKSLKRAV